MNGIKFNKSVLPRLKALFHPTIGLAFFFIVLLVMIIEPRIFDGIVYKVLDSIQFFSFSEYVSSNSALNLCIFISLILLAGYFIHKIIKEKKGNSYLSILFIFCAILFLSNQNWDYCSTPVSFDYGILLSVLFLLLFVAEIIAFYGIWKLKYKMPNNEIDKTKGFVIKTDDNDLIDIGWENYVNSIKQRLLNTDLRKGNFAIGISGGWGTGKTTFLHSLKKALNPNVDFFVAEFNPWNSNTPKQLIEDFFDTFRNEIHLHRKANKLVKKYSKVLSNLEGVKSISNMIDDLLPDNLESISSLKCEIGKQLELINKPIVIMIDDLDRLEKEELFEVLRLIRISADFKNVIFAVAYDKDYIVKQLEKKGIADASQYIEKIFHIEIILPKYESFIIPQLLFDSIKTTVGKDDVANQLFYEISRIRANGGYLISSFIKSFRDVKRFTNVFSLNLMHLINNNLDSEISYIDLFWIEILNYSYPDVYEIIKTSPLRLLESQEFIGRTGKIYYYTRSNSVTSSSDSQDKKDKEEFKKSLGDDVESLLRILFGNQIDKKNGSTQICYPNNFDKYFSYRIQKQIISNKDFNNLMHCDNQSLAREMKKLCSGEIVKSNSLFRHLESYLLQDCNEVEIAKNYFSIIALLVDYVPTWDFPRLYQNKLNKSICRLDVRLHVIDSIKNAISSTKRCWLGWEIILSKLYMPYCLDEEMPYRDEIILTNADIIDLCESNLKSYFDYSGIPPIVDITKSDSYLNSFIKKSVVTDNYSNDNESFESKCLVFDLLCKTFSITKSDKFDDFIKPYQIENEYYDESVVEIWQSDICKLFGDIKHYKTFIDKCFSVDEQRKRNHYSSLNILDI